MTRHSSLASAPTEANLATSGTDAESDTEFGGASRAQRVLHAGTVIGRYVIRERLGAGGMGEVFAAHDPELDREVALKLIHAYDNDGSHDVTMRERERLRTEAQALARLNHPNVVQIYEVGRHQDQTFLAMELVAGPTLSAWTASSLDELIEVYAQAGRGLAAAHAAGLAHRDFKPGNVIYGDDGRVRVLDFGLAEPAATISEAASTIGDDSDDLHVRSRSSIGGPGTLVYMAPEQAFSGTGGPAADQFSFCVALFEAVYGVRPFAAAGVMELLLKLETCTTEFPAESRLGRVPRWLRKLLARGLARHPEERFPSMDALLLELTRDRRRVWRRLAFAAGVSAVTALAVLAVTPDRSVNVVSAPAPDLVGVWDAQHRQAVSQAFARFESSWAQGSEVAVLAGLDAWSARWIDAAGHAQASVLDPLTSRAHMTCLDGQRAQAAATIDALIDADPVMLEGAVAAIDALPDPSRCSAAPSAELTQIDAELLLPQLQLLADATAQRNFGNFELARVGADAVLREAQAAGWSSVELAALRQRGLATLEAGDRVAGLDDLARARNLAVRSGDRHTEAELAVDLAWAGRKHDNLELRRERLALAQAHVDALLDARETNGDDRHTRLLASRLGLATALDLMRRGEPEQLDEAESLLVFGLGDLDAVEATDSALAIDYLHALALVRDMSGDHERAGHDYERAIARAERVRGQGHPTNARVWYDAGAYALERGDVELGRERLTRARDLRAAALRVDHPELARSELGLAELYFHEHDYARARQHANAALHTLDSATGDRDALPSTLRLLGELEAHEEHWQSAVAHYERALPLMTKPGVQRSLLELQLGKALIELGEIQRGFELLDTALPVIAARLGNNCTQMITSYQRHAEVAAQLGHHAAANASLHAALACNPDQPTRAQIEAQLGSRTDHAPTAH